MRFIAIIAAGLCFSTAAGAQSIVPIGPFDGNESDGFETQQSGSFDPCIIGRVFNNNGDLCTPGTSGAHITSGWGFMCTIQPHGGTFFTGSASGAYEYKFDTPVSRFGGYFGTNAGAPGGGTANFFDDGNNFLGSADINAPADCTWTWNGWESTGVGIGRIEVPSNVFGGAFLMMDDMEADIGSAQWQFPFCFGDGSGTPCPCNNPGAPGSGCANGFNPSGATLTATGSPQPDQLTLEAVGLVPNQVGLYFQGDNQINNGDGIPFGDGLRCVGGNVIRLELVMANANGGSATSVNIFEVGHVGMNDEKHYQIWYRAPNFSPCGSTFNFGSSMEVQWF